jgi:hypothetical protein
MDYEFLASLVAKNEDFLGRCPLTLSLRREKKGVV